MLSTHRLAPVSFPPKISNVSELCKRSSTEPPAAVAVSLFHSAFRSPTKAFNEFVCGGARKKKSYISANCQRSFCRVSLSLLVFLPVFVFVLLFLLRAAANCPFRLGSGWPRWRLACTCHATCAVAAARSRRGAASASAPRTPPPLPRPPTYPYLPLSLLT